MKNRFGFCFVILLLAQSGNAGVISPTKANGDFIPGTGIPNGDFTVSPGPNGESVALRVRGRDPGYLVTPVGNQYTVPAGNSVVTPTSPWWNFDYQFSPGASGRASSTYDWTLKVDFDPTVGSESFVTLSGQVSASGDLITNPGTWIPSTVPYVLANSLNLGFAFWSAFPGYQAYHSTTPGEYEIDFTVSDHTSHNVLATTTVFAEVTSVPAPPSIVLLGVGVLCGGITQVCRRIRRR